MKGTRVSPGRKKIVFIWAKSLYEPTYTSRRQEGERETKQRRTKRKCTHRTYLRIQFVAHQNRLITTTSSQHFHMEKKSSCPHLGCRTEFLGGWLAPFQPVSRPFPARLHVNNTLTILCRKFVKPRYRGARRGGGEPFWPSSGGGTI